MQMRLAVDRLWRAALKHVEQRHTCPDPTREPQRQYRSNRSKMSLMRM